MPWPTCEEGYNLRKLTLFAGQVVNDFKSLPSGPKKVVELTEDSPEILLEDLDLASWKHITIYFLGVPGGYYTPLPFYGTIPPDYPKIYFNGDYDESNYFTRILYYSGSAIIDNTYNAPLGIPPGYDATQWILRILFSGGRIRMWGMGNHREPGAYFLMREFLDYGPTAENLTSILLFSGDEEKPYKAGTRVEVW